MNLENALRRLRWLREPRTLWIDAICINQDDLDERAQQVMLMRKIYSKADRVLVWLGPEMEGVEHAFRLASSLRFAALSIQSRTPSHSELALNFNVVNALATCEEQGLLPPSLFAISELSAVFDWPWFARIWFVQEVIVSTDAIVLYGELEIPLLHLIFAAAFVLWYRSHWSSGTPLEFWYVISQQKFGDIPRNATEGWIGDLVHVLVSTRDFQATDPRDKLFALLGIVNEGRETKIGLVSSILASASSGLQMLSKSFHAPSVRRPVLQSERAISPSFSKSIIERVLRKCTETQLYISCGKSRELLIS